MSEKAKKLWNPYVSFPSVVIYHSNCPDGIVSAKVIDYFWKYKWQNTLKRPKYISLSNNSKKLPKDLTKDDTVIMVDISFNKKLTLELNDRVKKLLILDHHITNYKELKDLDYYCFDNDKSGCGLTWDWIYVPSNRPKVIDHIEDRDIWRWSHDYSKEFCYAFDTFVKDAAEKSLTNETNNTTDNTIVNTTDNTIVNTTDNTSGNTNNNIIDVCNIDNLFNSNKEVYDKLISNGSVLSFNINQKVKHSSNLAKKCVFNRTGDLIFIINISECRNEVSELLLNSNKDIQFVLSWTYIYGAGYVVSLRSDGRKDTSVVSEMFGGGGHKNASGFTLKENIHSLVTL